MINNLFLSYSKMEELLSLFISDTIELNIHPKLYKELINEYSKIFMLKIKEILKRDDKVNKGNKNIIFINDIANILQNMFICSWISDDDATVSSNIYSEINNKKLLTDVMEEIKKEINDDVQLFEDYAKPCCKKMINYDEYKNIHFVCNECGLRYYQCLNCQYINLQDEIEYCTLCNGIYCDKCNVLKSYLNCEHLLCRECVGYHVCENNDKKEIVMNFMTELHLRRVGNIIQEYIYQFHMRETEIKKMIEERNGIVKRKMVARRDYDSGRYIIENDGVNYVIDPKTKIIMGKLIGDNLQDLNVHDKTVLIDMGLKLSK